LAAHSLFCPARRPSPTSKLAATDFSAALSGAAGASSLKDVRFGKEAKALRRERKRRIEDALHRFERFQLEEAASAKEGKS